MNLFAPYLDYLLLYICGSCETLVKLYVLFVEMHGLRQNRKNEKFLHTSKTLHEYVPWEPADQPRNALCPVREETHGKRPGFAVYLAHKTHIKGWCLCHVPSPLDTRQKVVSLPCAKPVQHTTRGPHPWHWAVVHNARHIT
jgi:hypothetical protein